MGSPAESSQESSQESVVAGGEGGQNNSSPDGAADLSLPVEQDDSNDDFSAAETEKPNEVDETSESKNPVSIPVIEVSNDNDGDAAKES
jgi:hypothetical protein